MPKWPFKWLSKEPPSEPATEETVEEILRRNEEARNRLMEEARRSGARTLDLDYENLTALPEAIGGLSQLQVLNLFGNYLGELAEAIGELSQLQVLALASNELSTLPEAIGKLSKLQELDLSRNRLSTLPEAIRGLSQLQKLLLSGNRLSTLPEAVGQLSQLQVLNLSDNQLSTLPEAMERLERLKELFLHGNPGLGLPDEVLGPTIHEVFGSQKRSPKPPREILDYYFATRGVKGLALREVKLIVVGWGKAGKTTLVKRLAGEPMDPNEPETHGIMIRPLTLYCTDGELRARVWDFGGQHVLHAMHEFFLTTRSLYLLVLEQRSDRAETEAKYWLQLIRSYAGPAPVVVALNKSRGVQRPLDRDSLEKMYGPIVAWVPTECLPDEVLGLTIYDVFGPQKRSPKPSTRNPRLLLCNARGEG
jgi:internalin A